MQPTIFVGANMNIEKLSFAEMKTRIKEHLQMALNIEDFSINFAKQDGDVEG